LGAFFKTGVKVENACSLYDRLTKIDPKVAEQVGDFIRLKASQALESEGFLLLSLEALKNLLQLNLIDEEVHIFKRVIVWGQRQCIVQKLDLSKPEDMQKVLQEVLPLIRFPIMTMSQLSADVVTTKLLPGDHMVQIFTFAARKASGTSTDSIPWTLPYKTGPRK